MFRISDSQKTWIFGISQKIGFIHLGLDSEGNGKSETNLLSGPINITWDGWSVKQADWEKSPDGKYVTILKDSVGNSRVRWTLTSNKDESLWMNENISKEPIGNLKIEIPVNALMAAAVLIPSALSNHNQGLGPWLLVAPDFGQLMVTSDSDVQMTGINDGVRGGGSQPPFPRPPVRPPALSTAFTGKAIS